MDNIDINLISGYAKFICDKAYSIIESGVSSPRIDAMIDVYKHIIAISIFSPSYITWCIRLSALLNNDFAALDIFYGEDFIKSYINYLDQEGCDDKTKKDVKKNLNDYLYMKETVLKHKKENNV